MLAGLVLHHLGQPVTWGGELPALWRPSTGVGLVLVAWLGPAALIPIAADNLLVFLQVLLQPPAVSHLLPVALIDLLVGPLECWLLWRVYARQQTSRALAEPRSAILFLLLVPGLGCVAFALMRTALLGALHGASSWPLFAEFWLSGALGILTVSPCLLVVLTPILERRGLVVPDVPHPDWALEAPSPLSRGDLIETTGLTLVAGLYGTVLGGLAVRYGLAGWQVWGVPLLLIIWAALRQGLRGATLTSAAAAACPLVMASLLIAPGQTLFTLQGYLLAQGTTGLLLAVSGSWVRASEARYRRVVSHIPVMLYSARVTERRGQRIGAVVTFVSPACRAVLGVDPDALLGSHQRWLDLLDERDREILLAAYSQLSRQKEPVTCEYRLKPPPGTKPGSGVRVVSAAMGPALAGGDRPSLHLAPRVAERWVRDTLVPHFSADDTLEGWEGVVTEITEQRALAGDLRRATSMFNALVANLPAGVFFVQGQAGRPILVNSRARQLLGQREDPTAGIEHLAKIYRLHRPDGTPYPADELPVAQALRRGLTAMANDIVVHRPDGRRVPLMTWAAPIDLSGYGDHDAAVWVFEDISAMRQAETARRESEARLRAVIDTLTEGVIVQDAAGTILDCNLAACDILGMAGPKLRGRSLLEPEWQFLRDDGLPLPIEEQPALRSLHCGGPIHNVVIGLAPPRNAECEPRGPQAASSGTFRVPDCSLAAGRWLLVNAMPLTDGSSNRIVTTFADITRHLQALEGLRASEQKYRELVEELPLPVLLLDRDLRIEYANPATVTTTGYTLDAIREPALWQPLVHAEDRPAVLAALERALRAGAREGEGNAAQEGRNTSTLRYGARDGSEKIAFALFQPRWQDGQVIGATVLIVDLTRERKLEQELQRAQRLELVGRLASGIAHDFNNLLMAIIACVDLARQGLEHEPSARGLLDQIAAAAEQATSLAGQLLAFGKQKPAPRRVDVNRVVSRTHKLLRSSLPSNIEMEVTLTAEPLTVLADETQLHQVLMNLCLNSRDAMPRGGGLRVQTTAHRDECWACVSIKDTGEGIPAETLPRIFEPFFSTKERGTGLGLAVVQQIVEACGGRVEVSSQPGKGTQFDIWLPLLQLDRDTSAHSEKPL